MNVDQMSTRRPHTHTITHKLTLSTNDAVASQAIIERQLRDGTLSRAPRPAVLSTRVSAQARDQLAALARRRGTTPSKVLASIVTTLAESDIVQPTPEQIAALKAICTALELPAESDAETIRSALGALLEVVPQPEPTNTDPLQAHPEPEPAQLSRARGGRSPVSGRTFTTSRGTVTLSASEIESCKEMGAKLEAYAENKAIRGAARRPAQARRR